MIGRPDGRARLVRSRRTVPWATIAGRTVATSPPPAQLPGEVYRVEPPPHPRRGPAVATHWSAPLSSWAFWRNLLHPRTADRQ